MSDQREIREPHKVIITSPFWKTYRNLISTQVLPYQWEVMNDERQLEMPEDPAGNPRGTENSHVIRNLRIAAGLQLGRHAGFPFQDTDAYKWLESAAYSLEYHPDADLRRIADGLVDLIARAQDPDGYLVTLFQIEMPERKFKHLQQSHELYTMGHYIEAAVAYHESTGSEKALRVARKMADCIDDHFGPQEGKIHGVDGHPEIEIALVRLYGATGERRYLELASFFLHERGRDPKFFERQNEADRSNQNLVANMTTMPLSYFQAAKPIEQQKTADGHAVRMVYLCTGMAEVARRTGDDALLDSCRRFWNDIVRRRMYVTGNIGSTRVGESFTIDYDLPNDTMYGETCASVGMAFFARSMLDIELKSEYADVLERELYNGVIAGMSLDGKHFFYVNPLEADPRMSAGNPGMSHVLTRRAQWFQCACCPSNLTRLVASMDRYLYSVHGNVIASHQFVSNEADFNHGIHISLRSGMPWTGDVSYQVDNPTRASFQLAVRLPSWSADHFIVKVDGRSTRPLVTNGFIYIPISMESCHVEMRLDMRIRRLHASNRVRADIGQISFQRGPIIYCAEQADNPSPLWLLHVERDGNALFRFDDHMLGGLGILEIEGFRDVENAPDDPLYSSDSVPPDRRPITIHLIPYYAWANRKEGQMRVWLRE